MPKSPDYQPQHDEEYYLEHTFSVFGDTSGSAPKILKSVVPDYDFLDIPNDPVKPLEGINIFSLKSSFLNELTSALTEGSSPEIRELQDIANKYGYTDEVRRQVEEQIMRANRDNSGRR